VQRERKRKQRTIILPPSKKKIKLAFAVQCRLWHCPLLSFLAAGRNLLPAPSFIIWPANGLLALSLLRLLLFWLRKGRIGYTGLTGARSCLQKSAIKQKHLALPTSL